MKVRQLLCLICAVAMALPVVANAQVYKWKDKSGKVHYTDMPPPTNVETKTIGKKKPQRLPAVNTEPVSEPVGRAAERVEKPKFKEVVDPEEEAARVRQRNAEIEKNNKREKESQAKIDAENCIAAKSNYQTFAQGGRVYKSNENGEREYMSDNDLAAGKQKAQNEINKYCK